MKTKKPTKEMIEAREQARLVRYYDNTLQRSREIRAHMRDKEGLKVDRYIKNLFANVPGVKFTPNGDHRSGKSRSSNAARRRDGNKAMKKWWNECGRILKAMRENKEGLERGISIVLSFPPLPKGCKDAK